MKNKMKLKEENETSLVVKTGRFDNIDSAVIISSVGKAVKNFKELKFTFSSDFQFCTVFAYTADDDN